jgi:hypothetical protein
MKQRIKVHKIDIYDTTLHIICTPDARKKANSIFKKHNTGMVYKHYIEGIMITFSMNNYYFIIDARHVSYNTICHELYHLTQAITADRDIHEEESRAWCQGYIGNEIFKFMKESDIEITCI